MELLRIKNPLCCCQGVRPPVRVILFHIVLMALLLTSFAPFLSCATKLSPITQYVPGTNKVLKTIFGKPIPSLENQRQIVLVINSANERDVNRAFSNAVNIQNFYGINKLELVIIAYGPALPYFYRNSPLRDRVKSMQEYEIQFLACGNTLEALGKKPEDLLDGIDVVPAAIPEILERQRRAWSIFRP